MLNEKMFKKITRKHKNFRVMEIKNWEDELEEKVDFVYFTYNNNDANFIHIMLVVVYLEDEIEIEFIQQQKETKVLKEIKEKIYEIVMSEIKKEEKYGNHKITNQVNRERFKKYIMENERLKKKMERYVKEDKPKEEK